ncbi:MAG: spondin domain-containing protein [Pseudomonadales bacterium]|nr:spondin domain-containing protein [Pseudomonadales bacterium]
MRMAKYIVTAAIAAAGVPVSAAEVTVEVQNLTGGVYFTPLLVTAHSEGTALFMPGETASTELQAMAEGGDISGLVTLADSIGANSAANPAEGLLGPTEMTTAMLSTDEDNTRLSIVAMLLPTNDGFVGLNSWYLPQEPGEYTVYLNAYDAGTEANDEIRGSGAPGMPGMPVPPPLEDIVGTNGSGVTSMLTSDVVHVHPGNIGDAISDGGVSDVSNTMQRWLNPVAKVTVTVSE